MTEVLITKSCSRLISQHLHEYMTRATIEHSLVNKIYSGSGSHNMHQIHDKDYHKICLGPVNVIEVTSCIKYIASSIAGFKLVRLFRIYLINHQGFNTKNFR